MNRSRFELNLTSLAIAVALLFGVFSYSTAQEATSTLSGRIVGINGKPIAGLPIVIKPFQVIDGDVQYAYISSPISQTDDAGHFSIPNIVPISIQLAVRTSDYVIRSIKIGTVTVYQHLLPPFGGIAFEIKPGTHIENVEVTVKPRMRIRVQIVSANGTPLTNARVGIKVRHRSPDGMGSGTSSTSTETDDAGYLVQHVNKPGLYTVTANYPGAFGNGGAVHTSGGRTKGRPALHVRDRANFHRFTHWSSGSVCGMVNLAVGGCGGMGGESRK